MAMAAMAMAAMAQSLSGASKTSAFLSLSRSMLRPPLAISSSRRALASSRKAAACPRSSPHVMGSVFRASMSTSSGSKDAHLPWSELPYMGALVDFREVSLQELRLSSEQFAVELRSTVRHLKAQQMKSCWLQLPIALSGFAAVANEKEGFSFHHAKDDYVVLKLWLREGEEDKVPDFATHQVGCAGFVLNDKGELLVVKEYTGNRTRTSSPIWKLPGGMLDLGESFEEGACREVFEETGIECDFASVLCFWNRHGLTWGKSDLYVVCRLVPRTQEISMDEEEISECRWMPLSEFVATQNHPLILRICDVLYDLRKDELRPVESATPAVEMVRQEVTFPGRDGFATYFGVSKKEE